VLFAATMSDKGEGAHVTDSAVKPKKSKTCMRHCKRFWWVYLIAVICIIVLVVCLVIFVAVPKIAQHKIDDAKLEIQGVHVINTKSEECLIELNSTITTDGKIKANIDDFEGVIYMEDAEGHRPFVTVNFPSTTAAKFQTVNVSQEINITDMDAFTTFTTWFTNNETLRLTVDGKTRVKPSGLSRKYGVDFKHTVEVKGLDLFEGTRVVEKETHISFTPGKDGRNFHGIAEIPNHSVFTLDIGNATFTNFIDDEKVGELSIYDLVLRPGINRYEIVGKMEQAVIIDKVTSDKYCKSGIVDFKMLGKSVVNNGQTLSYFADALASANQTIPINIGQIIKQDLGSSLGCKSD
jgi:hypothetical protein